MNDTELNTAEGERIADIVSEVMAGKRDAVTPVTVTVTIPGPLLRIRVNRWVRADDVGQAWFDDDLLVLGINGKCCEAIPVDSEYLANVCDVLGIEKPEESK